MRHRRLLVAVAAVVSLGALPPSSTAGQQADAAALAERYAPIVRLVDDTGDCGPGKPYQPIDVDLLLEEPTVALRGPWGGADLVKIGPSGHDLTNGLFEYHLDFPGNALNPGCGYLRWERRLSEGHAPAVYAHVAGESGFPGKLALQYWFFYVFNDWNNLHEGDWEMVQLVFDASTPAEALRRAPIEVGYSQHEGAERASWDDGKLERHGGTHLVVHPAAGSHANFFGEALYLGSSAAEGVGCDDTRGPTTDIRPVVKTVASDHTDAQQSFPWIAFEGRWGELRPAFFNGPTGPNLKTQWSQPISWSHGWRDRSYTVPVGSAFGPAATGFFCDAVGTGSRALVSLVHRPLEFSLLLAGLLLLTIVALARATWSPSAPLRVARRRAWGQVLAASWRMYVERLPLFLGIGALLLPISWLVLAIQSLVLHATSFLGIQTAGEGNGFLVFLVLALGTALTLLGLGLVQAATARALVELDRGRAVGPLDAYRLALDSVGPLFGALLVAASVVSLLATSLFGLPVALWLAGLWALVAPVTELERRSAAGVLGHSRRLVRGRWLKVASLIVVGGALVLAAGPLVGVLLILATDAPFWLVNVVAGIVYAVTMPFLALTTTYVYFDLRARAELAPERGPDELPAELGSFA